MKRPTYTAIGLIGAATSSADSAALRAAAWLIGLAAVAGAITGLAKFAAGVARFVRKAVHAIDVFLGTDDQPGIAERVANVERVVEDTSAQLAEHIAATNGRTRAG